METNKKEIKEFPSFLKAFLKGPLSLFKAILKGNWSDFAIKKGSLRDYRSISYPLCSPFVLKNKYREDSNANKAKDWG